ncbi:MAG: hypothetical protein KKH34_05765, partial [Candidatus Omnitrophica bacterium]|nr:hypothetical protein [Candidatus Omnitrophota bacterium]
LKKWLCVTTTPIFDEANTIVGFICLSSDITRLKQAEEELKKNKEKLEIQVWGLEKTKSNFVLLYKEIKQRNEELEKAYEQLKSTQAQLIQAEKLKVIGRLAGGIAHDVKNPLSIILMGVDFLLKKIDNNDDSVHRALAEMKDAIGKANDIIKGLLDFSRPSELKIAPEDFNFIVKNALGLIKYECKKYRVEIIEELGENIPRVNTDKNKMEQVFVNIFLNAVQAMVYGGKLSVKTYIKELSEVVEEVGRRKEDTFQLGDSVVVAEISDTGPGITEDVLERIFDPFFTTKRDKGGTGLGLSVVQNIVDMHAGKIRIVTKKDGSGTVVTIMLPLSI